MGSGRWLRVPDRLTLFAHVLVEPRAQHEWMSNMRACMHRGMQCRQAVLAPVRAFATMASPSPAGLCATGHPRLSAFAACVCAWLQNSRHSSGRAYHERAQKPSTASGVVRPMPHAGVLQLPRSAKARTHGGPRAPPARLSGPIASAARRVPLHACQPQVHQPPATSCPLPLHTPQHHPHRGCCRSASVATHHESPNDGRTGRPAAHPS